MDYKLNTKVRILEGQYKHCTGRIQDATSHPLGGLAYHISIPIGERNVIQILTEDQIIEASTSILRDLEAASRRTSNYMSKSEYFGEEIASRPVQVKEKIISFTKEELLDIINQNKPAEEILLDLKDHITN
jgi:hypothetical protein